MVFRCVVFYIPHRSAGSFDMPRFLVLAFTLFALHVAKLLVYTGSTALNRRSKPGLSSTDIRFWNVQIFSRITGLWCEHWTCLFKRRRDGLGQRILSMRRVSKCFFQNELCLTKVLSGCNVLVFGTEWTTRPVAPHKRFASCAPTTSFSPDISLY